MRDRTDWNCLNARSTFTNLRAVRKRTQQLLHNPIREANFWTALRGTRPTVSSPKKDPASKLADYGLREENVRQIYWRASSAATKIYRQLQSEVHMLCCPLGLGSPPGELSR